jgi:hypothetical protein
MTPRQRPHPVADKLAVATLTLAGLVYASAATYAGNLLAIVVLWSLGGWAIAWLWRQYTEHTRPHALSPPAQPKAHIPALVRLMLLPGAQRIVGTHNVNKARRIKFLRTDLADRQREGEPIHTQDEHCPHCLGTYPHRYSRNTLPPGHNRGGWM